MKKKETASWQEEDAATERAEAKRVELRKISRELFSSGHPPGADVLELVADVVLACQCLRLDT